MDVKQLVAHLATPSILLGSLVNMLAAFVGFVFAAGEISSYISWLQILMRIQICFHQVATIQRVYGATSTDVEIVHVPKEKEI